MASEIRVLEDQLYDADYQNRVLQDKLQRYRQQVNATRIPTPGSVELPVRPYVESPIPTDAPIPTEDPVGPESVEIDSTDLDSMNIDDGVTAGDMDELRDGNLEPKRDEEPEVFDPDSFDPDMFDAGQPMDPEELSAPKPAAPKTPAPTSPARPMPKLGDPQPLQDPNSAAPGFGLPDGDVPTRPTLPRKPQFESLPPPAGIAPPGPRDLDFDPVIPGDIAPPTRNGGDGKPPGQILLPDSALTPDAVPESLRIHPGLTVGVHEDKTLAGATLVVNALDRRGRDVNLNDFEVAAELAVVVLDPELDAADAKIGRWDFSRKEVQAMIAKNKNGGLQIPVRWDDKKPSSDKVIVHVRLRGDDQEMRTEATLDLQPKTAASTWSPRGQ